MKGSFVLIYPFWTKLVLIYEQAMPYITKRFVFVHLIKEIRSQPILLLILATIEGRERNKDRIKGLQLALRFVKALFDEVVVK
jgi:hypothetical protein